MNWLRLILLALVCAFASIGPAGLAHADDSSDRQATITYVASEGVYLNAGTLRGLQIGDTLSVRRKGMHVGQIVVTNLSSGSSAAIAIDDSSSIQAGDMVMLPDRHISEIVIARDDSEHIISTPRSLRSGGSRLDGEIALSNYWHNDQTGSDLSWTQPGLLLNFEVSRIGSSDLTLRVKHRSRANFRSRTLGTSFDNKRWSHRLYELTLTNENSQSTTEWAIGRVNTPYVRGVGFVDGGYFARAINDKWKVGLAGGTAANRSDYGYDFDRRKAGVFVAYETGSYQKQRFAASMALSTEYDKAVVSRDFLYVQTSFMRGRGLATYHSLELDLNRNWRYDRIRERVTLSNYFGSARLSLHRSTSIELGYDTRKNILYFETRNIPDSLFDESINRGFRAAITIRFNERIRLRGSGGVRFREGSLADGKHGSLGLFLRKFPGRRLATSVHLSYVRTQLLTGYRPRLGVRFPATRRLMLNIDVAAQIYNNSLTTTSNVYANLNAAYSLDNGLYFTARFRQYFDDQLRSSELFTELSWRL